MNRLLKAFACKFSFLKLYLLISMAAVLFACGGEVKIDEIAKRDDAQGPAVYTLTIKLPDGVSEDEVAAFELYYDGIAIELDVPFTTINPQGCLRIQKPAEPWYSDYFADQQCNLIRPDSQYTSFTYRLRVLSLSWDPSHFRVDIGPTAKVHVAHINSSKGTPAPIVHLINLSHSQSPVKIALLKGSYELKYHPGEVLGFLNRTIDLEKEKSSNIIIPFDSNSDSRSTVTILQPEPGSQNDVHYFVWRSKIPNQQDTDYYYTLDCPVGFSFHGDWRTSTCNCYQPDETSSLARLEDQGFKDFQRIEFVDGKKEFALYSLQDSDDRYEYVVNHIKPMVVEVAPGQNKTIVGASIGLEHIFQSNQKIVDGIYLIQHKEIEPTLISAVHSCYFVSTNQNSYRRLVEPISTDTRIDVVPGRNYRLFVEYEDDLDGIQRLLYDCDYTQGVKPCDFMGEWN